MWIFVFYLLYFRNRLQNYCFFLNYANKWEKKNARAGYFSMVGATFPTAPSVRIAKSRQSSMAKWTKPEEWPEWDSGLMDEKKQYLPKQQKNVSSHHEMMYLPASSTSPIDQDTPMYYDCATAGCVNNDIYCPHIKIAGLSRRKWICCCMLFG